MPKIRVGTRGSRLALVQTHYVMERLRELDPSVELSQEIIQTEGDRVTDRPLNEVGGTGLFIKEIEKALLEGRIDMAVHSMKDVPSVVPDGLVLAATTRRADPRDALVSRSAATIETLPEAAELATGSLRRRSQLLVLRPDLRIHDLRGNVPTRLRKFDESSWEAIVVAGAGLTRLGLTDRIRSHIPVEIMLPAVGQGALAIETRAKEKPILDVLAGLNHEQTETAVVAERAFLARLEGGCQVPIGAYAQLRKGELHLQGFVGTVDGAEHVRQETSGRPAAAAELGVALAESMLEAGAGAIVDVASDA